MTAPEAHGWDAAALEALLAGAAEGETVRLSGAFTLDRPIRLDRSLALVGPEADPAVIWLASPAAHLSLAAEGCRIGNLVVATKGLHNGPMLRIAETRGVGLARVGLVGAHGVGLLAEGCEDLVLDGISALGIGGEALVFDACRNIRVEAACRNIARNRRAPALLLRACNSAVLTVTAMDVSGSAVTIEAPDVVPLDCRLDVTAIACARAATVLGTAASPATGLDLRVRSSGATDCAALLTNIAGGVVDVAAVASEGVPALRLEGASGVRGCEITLAGGPDLAGGRRTGENRLRHRPLDMAEIPDASAVVLPEAVTAAFAQRGERIFVPYETEGRCRVCGAAGRFRCSHPAERESLGCPTCGATLRYRGQAGVIVDLVGETLPDHGAEMSLAELVASGALADLAIFEPGVSGPLRPYLRRAKLYRQSVYEPGIASGTPGADGIEHQDLMALSYPDRSFDLVVTSDIFEHVRKPFAAFREVHRVLKPGGAHVFTIPFRAQPPERTTPRVDTSGPEDRFLLPPIHHGSGTGGESLVYTDFGRDLGHLLDAVGFSTRIVRHPGRNAEETMSATIVSTRIA